MSIALWVVFVLASPGPAAPKPYADELQLCVDRTNQYRASIKRPALTRSPKLDDYAEAAARSDGLAHSAHRHFRRTRGGGVARAENEIPWWALDDLGSVQAIVLEGLSVMWREGPKGGHYANMAGPYTEIGCGIFVNGNEVTLTQAFR